MQPRPEFAQGYHSLILELQKHVWNLLQYKSSELWNQNSRYIKYELNKHVCAILFKKKKLGNLLKCIFKKRFDYQARVWDLKPQPSPSLPPTFLCSTGPSLPCNRILISVLCVPTSEVGCKSSNHCLLQVEPKWVCKWVSLAELRSAHRTCTDCTSVRASPYEWECAMWL